MLYSYSLRVEKTKKMDIFGGVKKSGDVLKALITVFGVMLFTAVVFYLLMGTFVQQANDGNLPVDNGTITDIGNVQDNFSSIVGTLSSNAITVVSFVILGIIILIASVFLGKKLGSGKGKGGADF